MAKSVRSSQQKRFELPPNYKDSEDLHEETEFRQDAEHRGQVKRSGPYSVQKAQNHERLSHDSHKYNIPSDNTNLNQAAMELLLGQESGSSRPAQFPLGNTDSKAAKKKIDIKNLINQSKIKRFQSNLNQGPQASKHTAPATNPSIRSCQEQ